MGVAAFVRCGDRRRGPAGSGLNVSRGSGAADGRDGMTMSVLEIQQRNAAMSEPLARLFQRLLDEMESRESVEWDAAESTLDAGVYSDP